MSGAVDAMRRAAWISSHPFDAFLTACGVRCEKSTPTRAGSVVPRRQVQRAPEAALERLQLENDLRQTLAQTFGRALLVLGATQAWRTYQLALSTDATERFFKASSQLDSASAPVRV